MSTCIPSQAAHIIGKLGGINNAARVLGHTNASTVQGWKERGFIPSHRHAEVLELAKASGVDLCPEDFIVHLAAAAKADHPNQPAAGRAA